VLTNPLRAAMLAGALSLLAALVGSVAVASAAVESSQITTPAGPTYALNNESEASSTAFAVEGKVTKGSGNVRLRCYFGKGSAEEYATLVSEVTPELSGSFSADVPTRSLPIGPCVLRAVPVGDNKAYPPGTPTEEASDPFKGPRIVGSFYKLFTEGGGTYNYEFQTGALGGYFNFTSVGEWGLEYSYLFTPETLTPSYGLFYGNAALYEEGSSRRSSTRSELQVDGANAYSPAVARRIEQTIGAKTPLPGAPQASVTESFHEGLVTVTEVDPIVECAPNSAAPPTSSGCTSFVSAGVELERQWQTSSAGQVASMTDTWRSTDGAAHSLSALYDQAMVNGENGGAYQFPGTTVFKATKAGEAVTLPPGPGAIYYKGDAKTPSEGDGVHPQGAIVYDTPPSEPISVGQGAAAAEKYNEFEMPYKAAIPAGGSYTLRMAFIQAFELPEVQALARDVLESYPPSSPPTLTIASPANGTIVSTPTVTVSGTATDTRGITSLTVDGQPVSVGTGGAWSTSVSLQVGANTIKAIATDQAGYSTEATVSVTYTPIPPVAHASQVGSVHGGDGEVTFTIVCNGSAGTSCEVESTVTTVERTHGGRPVAVSARRRRQHGRSSTVTVGSSKLTIPAGQRVTIAIQLSATGKSLLAQFGALPVHLSVAQIVGGHRSTIVAENLTVTPHRRHHKRRHHHHHR
jgi:Glucodextranase, domain B